jgi:uncharacterized membrane protein
MVPRLGTAVDRVIIVVVPIDWHAVVCCHLVVSEFVSRSSLINKKLKTVPEVRDMTK